MEGVDKVNDAARRVLSAKDARRRRLASEPFPVKIEALVRLQEMAAPILRRRGRMVRPWQLTREPPRP